MSEPWFERSGKSGYVSIEREGGSWYVASTSDGNRIKCLLDKTPDVASSVDALQIKATVSNYMRGSDDSVNHLILDNATVVRTLSASDTEMPSSEQRNHKEREAPEWQASQGTDSTKSHSSTSSRSNSKSSSRRNKSLDSIAEKLIGNKELTLSDDDDSAIGNAKKKARKQQRDPAVDPKFKS